MPATSSSTPALVRALVAAVTVLLVVALLPAPGAHARTTAEAAAEAIMLELHQQARTSPRSFTSAAASPGTPFTAWSDMVGSARRWSAAQARGICPDGALMCHNRPDNGGPGYRNEMCCAGRAAENVAVSTFRSHGTTPTTAELRSALRRTMTGYMDSESHRRNILNPHFDHVGTSVALRSLGDGYWRLHTTTVFRQYDGSPIDATLVSFVGSPSPAPAVTRPPGERRPPATCPTDPRTRFDDVAPGSPVGRAAGCLGDLGIAAGFGDGTYRPASAVTRGQMASFLVRLVDRMGRSVPATEGAAFRDIGGTHAGAITGLHAAGIASGRADGRFAPGARVTRAQMASFLVRAAEWAGGPLPAGTGGFRDVHGSPHADSIDRLAAAGIARGTGPGTFSPDRPVTRGQMALFLTRLLEHHASG